MIDAEFLLRSLIRRIKCETKVDKEQREKENMSVEKRKKQKKKGHSDKKFRIKGDQIFFPGHPPRGF